MDRYRAIFVALWWFESLLAIRLICRGHSSLFRFGKYLMNQDTNVDEKLNSDWKRSVNFSCLWFLRKVLWRQGAASNDLIDTMAAEMTEKVLHFAGWCHDMRGDC